MAENEELKSLLMKAKEESEKAGLKLNIKKTNGIWSHHFVATMADFIFLGSKIPADGDYRHEIKWHLLLGRKAVTNLDSILKIRDIILPAKVHISSQSYGFSSSHVWMWELDYKENWAPKNWCFWLLRVPWTERRSNQSILKEINPEYSLEALILKLKLK